MKDKSLDDAQDNLNVVRLRTIVREWGRHPGHEMRLSVGFLRDLLYVIDKQDRRIRELKEGADNEA